MSDIDETSSESAYMSARDVEEDGASNSGSAEIENQGEAKHPDLQNLQTSSNSSSPALQKTPSASVAGESPPKQAAAPSLASGFIAPPPSPRYFAARDDGSLTPLIAVDELPTYVQIHGVPRTLTAADTMGMISLGTVTRSNGRYVLQILETAHGLLTEETTNKSIKHFASASEASEVVSNADVSTTSFVPRRIKEWVKGQSNGDDKDRQVSTSL